MFGRRNPRLRRLLRDRFAPERAEELLAAYRAAGPLSAPEAAALNRLGPDVRDRVLRGRYPSPDALTAAIADLTLHTGTDEAFRGHRMDLDEL